MIEPMHLDANIELEEWLREAEHGARTADSDWRQELLAMKRFLRMVMPIEQIERVERQLKRVLRRILAQKLDGASARFIAGYQRDVGFVLKCKSYALKCTSPLGYSIFLQKPHEGFSFQRHISRKTEVFHILEPLDGARVFLSSSEEWNATYERERFDAWLNGRTDTAFDRHAIVPESGDVFHVDRLGIVHSVLGCTLEEYATVSIDMVDRLHDQNEGHSLAFEVRRDEVEAKLRTLPIPEYSSAFPNALDHKRKVVLEPAVSEGVALWRLSTGTIEASRYFIKPGSSTKEQSDESRAAAVFVLGGRGEIAIGDESEIRAGLPALSVEAGDLLLIPPRCYRAFRAAKAERLVLSEQRIEPALALD
jgi:mannose-6-phosphate isomerase-like protein (cupin superfamily)